MRTRLPIMLAIVAIVAVCGLTAVCYAQKKARTGITPVLEKSFKDTLENVIWGDTIITVSTAKKLGVKEMGGKNVSDQVKVMYPKVQFVTKNGKPYHSSYNNTTSMRFLDINGKIKKELLPIPRNLDLNGINISKNKKYICATTWTERKFMTIIEGRETDAPLYESAVYDMDGRLLRIIKQVNPSATISPNGKYIVCSNAEYGNDSIRVYDEKGLIREIQKDDLGWDLDFSSDGSWFTITSEVKDTSIFDLSARLLVLNEHGKELWRKERLAWGLAATTCFVKITNDSLITVITGSDDYKVYKYDKNGILLNTEQGTIEQLRGFKNESNK